MISFRKLLFVVPGFVAVGIAAACGPYTTPACCPQPQQPPQTYYYEPVTDPQGRTYYVQRSAPVGPAPGVSGTSLSVLDGKIQVQTADGARMAVEKLTILVNGVDPAEVAVSDKLIKITGGKDVKDGCFLQASARKVTRTATDGAQLILEGDAKLLYARKGKKIEVSTDAVSVNLLTGQVISELDAPKPAAPPPTLTPGGPPTAPEVGPGVPSPAAPPPTAPRPTTSY